jgi:major membrane immunogen (membrane-anchored lipoprotein)
MAYRYKPKVPKSQAPPKGPFVEYYPHSKQKTERDWNGDYYQTVSIDPARKHYAIRIERSYKNGKIIPLVFDKQDVDGEPKEESEDKINTTYDKITALLDKYKKYYNECHYIIVEKQLPYNYKVVRVEQHTVSYFSFVCRDQGKLPSIISVCPQLKGKMLGIPKGCNEKQTKQWAIEKGFELLEKRKDDFSIEVLKATKKKDDLGDTVCQREAFFIYMKLHAHTTVPLE